jgi:hypothetical protein
MGVLLPFQLGTPCRYAYHMLPEPWEVGLAEQGTEVSSLARGPNDGAAATPVMRHSP